VISEFALLSKISRLAKAPPLGFDALLKECGLNLGRLGPIVESLLVDLSPNGTVSHALSKLSDPAVAKSFFAAYESKDSKARTQLLELLPKALHDKVVPVIEEYFQDPASFEAAAQVTLSDPAFLVGTVKEALAPPTLYRCQDCGLPFFSSNPKGTISCPHCE
jgi:hypothetical protein